MKETLIKCMHLLGLPACCCLTSCSSRRRMQSHDRILVEGWVMTVPSRRQHWQKRLSRWHWRPENSPFVSQFGTKTTGAVDFWARSRIRSHSDCSARQTFEKIDKIVIFNLSLIKNWIQVNIYINKNVIFYWNLTKH